jgi:glycosyltransferase involved in cell wall biosynthesis
MKENFIMTVGRLWDKAKNTALLRDLAPALAWPVYVAGEEKHPDGITETEYGNGKKRTDNFYRLGRLSPQVIASWLSRASIYALPAYYEPFGLSVLEAGLSGCALVLGDIPSLREIWGEAAVFVPPGDTIVMKEAIQELIGNAEYRKLMASRARDRALRFSPQRMAEGYLEVYRALMERKGLKMQSAK